MSIAFAGRFGRAAPPCEVGAADVFVFNEDEKIGKIWLAKSDRREAAGKRGKSIEGLQVLKGFRVRKQGHFLNMVPGYVSISFCKFFVPWEKVADPAPFLT